MSYTLSTLTVPTLLTLPSASTAAKAFRTLTTTAKTHLLALAGVSSASFFLAFLLSPRLVRHPYLLYTSVLVLSSRLAVSDYVAPYLFKLNPPASSSPSSTTPAPKRKEPRSVRKMEMSYDMIGSDAHSEGTDSASDKDLAEVEEEQPALNGEEVRGEVENFLKKQVVSTTMAGLGFMMAVVGIWGDGVALVSETVVNVFEI